MKRTVGLHVCLAVFAVAQAAYYYPRLPDTVASHFDLSGQPDRYMSKETVVAVHGGVVALLAAMFLGINFIIGKVPDTLVSMPNKDYWLAPERRTQTYDAISSLMLWFGCATIAFLLGAFQIAVHANLSEDRRMRNVVFWSLLAVYAIFVCAWLIRLILRFTKVPG
jgi:uncharacterized membrane protein